LLNQAFIEKLIQIRKEICQYPFFIIIWGPGITSGSPLARKRLRLRDFLSEEFGIDNIIFPEDQSLQFLRDKYGDYAKEFYEVLAADALIIIPESPGSISEVALYRSQLKDKSIIFVKSRPLDQQGFAFQVYEDLNFHSIEPEEWETCDRIMNLARQFIERKRIDKFLGSR
jgi:hypothetical protein